MNDEPSPNEPNTALDNSIDYQPDTRLSHFGRERVRALGDAHAEARGEVADALDSALAHILDVRTQTRRMEAVKDPILNRHPPSPGIIERRRERDPITPGDPVPGRPDPGERNGELVTTLDVDVDELRRELLVAVLDELEGRP